MMTNSLREPAGRGGVMMTNSLREPTGCGGRGGVMMTNSLREPAGPNMHRDHERTHYCLISL